MAHSTKSRWLSVLLTFACVTLDGRSATASEKAALVPCTIFAPGVKCVRPINEGVVDGQWVGLISHYNGTNGGPDVIAVVTIGFGGNGFQTTFLPAIKPDGSYGDRMGATFRNGKLFVSNAIYLPGEAHCCFTHTTTRRFGFHNKKLMVEREATTLTTATASEEDAALEKGAHFF